MINETIEDIKKRMTLKLLSTPPFLTINMSPSNVALWSKFMDVVSSEVHYMEQLLNDFETEIEGIIAGVTTPTDQWWQAKALEFQYTTDPANQQVIKIDLKTFAPAYPVIIPSYRIIKNASAKTLPNNVVQIKVTKGGVILDSPELAAFKAYCETICPGGVNFDVINELPDRLGLTAEIFYNGQYSAVIPANVIAAINTFLKTIPFNGVVKISELEDSIQAVEGVTDIVISSVSARRLITSYASRTILSRYWQTYAGEIIQEDDAGHTFNDTLTFTAE
jgi:hypothetical protein